MKWLLILMLVGPDNVVEGRKTFPGFISKEQCVYNGEMAEAYYAQYGVIVRHSCVTDI